MKTLSLEQMENVEGGRRNDAACYKALAVFTLSVVGVGLSAGWGLLVAGASLVVSYHDMVQNC